MTITEFLLERIAEDEETAEAVAFEGGWFAHEGGVWVAHDPDGSSSSGLTDRLPIWAGFAAEHIVRFQPSRIMAECEAKRRIVEDHRWLGMPEHHRSAEVLAMAPDRCRRCWDGPGFVEWPCPTLRALALPYADHPDFNPEWRP